MQPTIERDLARPPAARCAVTLLPPGEFAKMTLLELAGESLDGLPIAVDRYEVDPSSLRAAGPVADETLRTDSSAPCAR